ncbi:hypothetical protein SETIT_6G054300v2 [Setaria italica]|uniref:Uncharacterized protein n=1 Tax=Setaria italica TaxID=4555 RepID=A0A368RIH9_SETIT|nr:hypothetical protein SETIT_6G054300v2 [Setaria italica]
MDLEKLNVAAEVDEEDKSFDPKKYENSVRRFKEEDLVRMSATLGYKSVIIEKVAREKAMARQKSMLVQSGRVMQLEARNAQLEEQVKILLGLKNELTEIKSGLERNNSLLKNTCSELVEKNDELSKETY